MTFQWCFAIEANCGLRPEGRPKGAIPRDVVWPRNTMISVAFMRNHGSDALRSRIRRVAQQWLAFSGITLRFEWRAEPPADIRISLDRPGSWSCIGTTCQQIDDQAEPTMNYGWLTDGSTDIEVQEVVLHEFGHALGFIHEHQHPQVNIPWNREAVYRALGQPPNRWARETIDLNFFLPYDTRDIWSTEYDARSIMHYPIPGAWTDGIFEVGNNTELSDRDIDLVRQVYLRAVRP